MKVLIPVPLDIPDKVEIICGRCGATLEVEPNDFDYNSNQHEGSWFSCNCGNCGERISIDYQDYPFKNAITYVCRNHFSKSKA